MGHAEALGSSSGMELLSLRDAMRVAVRFMGDDRFTGLDSGRTTEYLRLSKDQIRATCHHSCIQIPYHDEATKDLEGTFYLRPWIARALAEVQENSPAYATVVKSLLEAVKLDPVIKQPVWISDASRTEIPVLSILLSSDVLAEVADAIKKIGGRVHLDFYGERSQVHAKVKDPSTDELRGEVIFMPMAKPEGERTE